ncbi:MAG: carboxypeptidase regulatory-like domain-containing protein, partial [Acidobacteriota bacterium]
MHPYSMPRSRRSLSKLPSLLVAGFMLAISFFVTPAVNAQNSEVTGAIEGKVTNSQKPNEPIANASVQIVNLDSDVPTATKTDASGHFMRPNLPPGRYKIIVKAPNFKDYESDKAQRVDITVTRGVVPVPIALEPLTAAATTPPTTPAEPSQPGVTPSPAPAASPAPKVVSSELADETNISTEMNNKDARRGGGYRENEVSTLPLGGTTLTRSFDELALLVPGVAPPPQTGGDVAGPGVGPGVGSAGQFAVNGMRSRANNFTVDGSDNNDEDIGVRRQGFFSLVPQPIESIQEYRVTTLLAPAQYGRNFGAQVNAVSKSGGNQIHGTLFG